MERDLIDWLGKQLPGGEPLRLGIGDDAAVLDWQNDRDLVVTTDLLIDGVHFDLASGVDPRRVGRKSLAVNLSDLAAMAARPVGAVVSLALPRAGGMKLAKSLYQGMLPLADQFDCLIVGGDTNSHEGPLVVSVTVFGEPITSRVWTRKGAVPGDRLLVTGQLGGSLLGKHLDFTPRVEEALLLAERYEIHAAMDISDGLSLDLARLAQQSACGATIGADLIPISADAIQSGGQGDRSPLERALSDGEDFELLLAVRPEVARVLLEDQPLGVPLTDIGEVTADVGAVLIEGQGGYRPLKPTGYEHPLDA